MREILFRGKDSNDIWRQFGLFEDEPGWYIDPETIGQYTGLNDIFCKKMFDGDIVYDDVEDQPAVITWYNGSFVFVYEYGLQQIIWSRNKDNHVIERVRVVDNIYSGTELARRMTDARNLI